MRKGERNRRIEFLTTLGGQTGNDARLGLLLNALESFGIAQVKYGFSLLGGVPPEVTFLGGYDRELEDLIARERFDRDDLTIHHCMRRTSPIFWSTIIDAVEAGTVPAASARAHRTIMEYGLVNGIVLPLRDHTALGRGGIGLAGHQDESIAAFDRRIAAHLSDIRFRVEAFHASVDRASMHLGPRRLSPREIECLTWLIHGLRTQRIAERLGLSDRTVEHHIDRARAKLNAATREQAVAKALMLGLIAP